jgi:type VI secretion system secreted protein VgrG
MAAGKRIHEVKSPLPPEANGDSPLLLIRLHAKEELSRPFEYTADLLSEHDDIDPNKLLGKPMAITVRTADDRVRCFQGLVSNFSYRGPEAAYAHYQAVIRPWFWFLARNRDCRIFQDMTVRDVFEKVAKDTHQFSDFKWNTTATYKKRDYCVQYRESDFNFLSRLLEEEGIYYYFEHEESKHTMILGDSYTAFTSIKGTEKNGPKVPFRAQGEAGLELEHVSEWQVLHELQSGTTVIDDFDFEKPKVELQSKSQISREHAQSKFEVYDYPGLYWVNGDGDQLSKVRIEELQSNYKRLAGTSDHRELNAGKLFKLAEHPRKGEDAEYALIKTETDVESGEIAQTREGAENKFAVKFVAIPSRDPFRPARTTKKPFVHGPQTAIVVGKSGEEIWTDKYGRVKLQFHWDREGKSDENSSCWIRVSQAWAGKNWGSMHIPRIGQEVVVTFLEGDPDRPLVIGRVYNADLMPPYGLPDNQTQSGILSRSSKGGTGENANELRFEDKKGEEKVTFHAEKDFDREVENNDSLKVGSAKAEDGSQTIEIWKNRSAEIKTGDDVTKVTAGSSTIEAAQKITLKVGASTIVIEPAKISLSSPEITVTGNAKISASAPMTEVSGAGALTLSGGMVKIN